MTTMQLLAAVQHSAQLAMTAAFGDAVAGADPLVRSSEFADFQLNAALPLARVLRQNPRQIAQAIVDHFDLTGVVAAASVSGPGYINITVAETWLAAHLPSLLKSDTGAQPKTVVIDYSSPNVAKEMHVGHLRTTIVGDALANMHEHLGNTVIRQNHIGDWGTPFGMLIEYSLDQTTAGAATNLQQTDPNAFYQAARVAYETDPEFAQRARARVVKLQHHDPATIDLWAKLVARSVTYFTDLYATLQVNLSPTDIRGESAYDGDLAAICDELTALGLTRLSDGALCVFPPGYKNKHGDPLPLMLQKQDGGYTYAVTDLAAAKYRLQTLGADQILYVVGEAQALHLAMVFDTVNLAGWNPKGADLTHVQIGNMVGSDGKLLRTRSGSSLKLAELIQDAVAAAQQVLSDTDLPATDQQVIAQQVGVGALKYADLAVDHATSYMFDLKRMVALTGNTGPYLQYTCVRVKSILRQVNAPEDAPLLLDTVEEKNLAMVLAAHQNVLAEATAQSAPHLLCAHLFNLAQVFSRFYTQQPVLKEADPNLLVSRLHLCEFTLAALTEGLGALGIPVPNQM